MGMELKYRHMNMNDEERYRRPSLTTDDLNVRCKKLAKKWKRTDALRFDCYLVSFHRYQKVWLTKLWKNIWITGSNNYADFRKRWQKQTLSQLFHIHRLYSWESDELLSELLCGDTGVANVTLESEKKIME